jgi:hypothetical protein
LNNFNFCFGWVKIYYYKKNLVFRLRLPMPTRESNIASAFGWLAYLLPIKLTRRKGPALQVVPLDGARENLSFLALPLIIVSQVKVWL